MKRRRQHPQATAMERAMRERRAQAREKSAHVDFDAFVAQVKALPVFKDCPRSIRKTEVCIVYSYFGGGGRAHGNRFVRIVIGPATPLEWVLETIVHELAHAALPDVGHNERFRRTLARAARELWGIDLDPNPKNERGRTPCYALDRNIEVILRDGLAVGWLSFPKRELKPMLTSEELAVSRAARRAVLVERRAAHATKMFERAENRLAAAQKTVSKWRQKMRYYERVAAKKRGST